MDLLVYSGALLFVLLHVLGLALLLLNRVAHLKMFVGTVSGRNEVLL